MALKTRVSITSPRLSICADDTSRLVTGSTDEESKSPTATSLASFLSMSRVKQLTVVSFSLSNLGVGCFFSVLGPFFPREVYRVLSILPDDQSS